MAFLLYRILFPIAFLIAVPFYALRLWRRERGRAAVDKPAGYELGLGQRFGRYSPGMSARLAEGPAPWWLCSISVGETLIALKLARALREQEPAARVVISVTTSTGYELLLREAAKLDWLTPLYNPIDFHFAAKAAVRQVRPRALVLIEGGIWPNLLLAAHRRGVPVALAGARLSPRSERRWLGMPRLGRAVWPLFDLICVPEPEDAARFVAIGAREKSVLVTGSMKFDAGADHAPSREAEFRRLVQPLGFTGPILVAGSTWAPEEKMLAKLYGGLRKLYPTLRLIVVPRHVERADEVEREFVGRAVIRRSQLPRHNRADVLIVDTTGELRDWYRLATVVFVGKSLSGVAELGGQNPGEPAGLGLPVVFGPHMENFAALVAHLREKDAAVQVDGRENLTVQIAELLGDPGRCAELGARGKETIAQHQGATQRTAQALVELQKRQMISAAAPV